jgi:3-hydroxyisobutyrate dehydrogenase-like beta-hydroxyacid dehydrogenase
MNYVTFKWSSGDALEVVVLDIMPDRGNQLIQEFNLQNKGPETEMIVTSADSIADFASRCDTIITMLPNTNDVLETVAGPEGILKYAKKGEKH